MKYKTVILDRDGVINQLVHSYVRSPQELKFIPGSTTAIRALLALNKKVIIASNQAGVGKGLFTINDLEQINQKINTTVGASLSYFYCTHTKDENCGCRKPQPGLLTQIKARESSPHIMVGDNITDIKAAQAANIPAILVKTGHGKKFVSEVNSDTLIFSCLETAMRELSK
jgi:D-glycero-D-manno-heptose 1,7-bisphosphate phosphatase